MQSVEANEVKKKKKRADRRFITPKFVVFLSIAFLAIITQVPFGVTLYYSTLNWNLLYPDRGTTFVGLANYAQILQNPAFLSAAWVTVKFTVSILSLSLLFGLCLALLLRRAFKGKSIVRNMLFAPFLVMTTVTALVWKNMILDPSYGFLAGMFKLIGLTPIDVIGSYPFATIVTVAVWTWTPFMMLILHAALESIPEDILEAAHMDGAGKWTTFFHIVAPYLRQYIFICVLLGAIMVIPLFGEVALITAGGPGKMTTNLSYAVFKEAFHGYNIGSASAYGVVAALITMAIGIALIRVFEGRKEAA